MKNAHLYDVQEVVNPDFVDPKSKDARQKRGIQQVAPDAVLLQHPQFPAGVIVTVVNGTMACFPADRLPDSVNFGPYMADVLPPTAAHVQWNPATSRYE